MESDARKLTLREIAANAYSGRGAGASTLGVTSGFTFSWTPEQVAVMEQERKEVRDRLLRVGEK
jgi:hypothetical protein